jgi:hypothetical protein
VAENLTGSNGMFFQRIEEISVTAGELEKRNTAATGTSLPMNLAGVDWVAQKSYESY